MLRRNFIGFGKEVLGSASVEEVPIFMLVPVALLTLSNLRYPLLAIGCSREAVSLHHLLRSLTVVASLSLSSEG